MVDATTTYPIELWQEAEGQWGFKVGNVVQLWDPEEPGNTPMDEARAEECAKTIQARLSAA